MDTFNVVYRRLQDFDFRRDALHFDVPAYFFLGCYDVNATYWLAEDYFTKLQVPHKRLESSRIPVVATFGGRPTNFTR